MAVTDSTIRYGGPLEFEDHPIRLGADINFCYQAPFYGGIVRSAWVEAFDSYPLTVVENGATVSYTIDRMKSFLIGGGLSREDFGYGIGPMGGTVEGDVVSELVFAIIDGKRIGTPIDSSYVLSHEADDEPLGLSVVGYPNPASRVYRISVSNGGRGIVDTQVIDLLGRRLWQRQGIPVQNAHEEIIDLSGFASGQYFIVVESGGRVARSRFSVVH